MKKALIRTVLLGNGLRERTSTSGLDLGHQDVVMSVSRFGLAAVR